MLYAKTVFDKPGDEDGYRILCTKDWPKKLPPSWADGFNPNLAPSEEIYTLLLDRKIMFEEFAQRFGEQLEGQRPRLESLKKQSEKFNVTIVGYPDFEGRSISRIVVEKCLSI
jgi:uncharacterized protein YeaO (DUF488 family)